jgi:hypothetical protein
MMSDDSATNAQENLALSKIVAINSSHQPTVDRIAKAMYRAERELSEVAPSLGALQKLIFDESRKLGIHPSSLLAGTYKKDDSGKDYTDTGFVSELSEAVALASKAAVTLAISHKQLTRIFCDLKIINDGGGGK